MTRDTPASAFREHGYAVSSRWRDSNPEPFAYKAPSLGTHRLLPATIASRMPARPPAATLADPSSCHEPCHADRLRRLGEDHAATFFSRSMRPWAISHSGLAQPTTYSDVTPTHDRHEPHQASEQPDCGGEAFTTRRGLRRPLGGVPGRIGAASLRSPHQRAQARQRPQPLVVRRWCLTSPAKLCIEPESPGQEGSPGPGSRDHPNRT